MNQELRFRPAIDLDELDRQLRNQPARAVTPDSYDPLAELARIVGQPSSGQPAERTPLAEGRAPQPHLHDRWLDGQPAGGPPLRDAFPAELPGESADGADDFHEGRPIPVTPHASRRRSLLNARSLIIATGVVAVSLLGLYTVFAMRAPSSAARSKEPPVIVAKATPAKEKPDNPGGSEVPNQNAQIYERKPEDSAKKPNVVSNVEQPVDLSASVKRDAPRVILPGPDGKGASALTGSSPLAPSAAPPSSSAGPAAFAPTQPPAQTPGATPSPSAPIVTSSVPNTLTPPPPVASNEPKRVKSVAIKATVTQDLAAVASDAAAPAPAPSVPTPPSVSRGLSSGVTPANSTPSITPARPSQGAPPKVAARETPKETIRGRTPPVAAAAPAQDAGVSADSAADGGDDAPLKLAPPPKSARSGAVAAAIGGWSVQLASRPTEGDAKTEAARLGQRYASTLEGASPRVVSGAANGGTVYRVRVGSYTREKATQMCESIKSAGGICFISKS